MQEITLSAFVEDFFMGKPVDTGRYCSELLNDCTVRLKFTSPEERGDASLALIRFRSSEEGGQTDDRSTLIMVNLSDYPDFPSDLKRELSEKARQEEFGNVLYVEV